ncbi:MAG: DUF4332 domain-containing protein [Chitinophagales bacterium]
MSNNIKTAKQLKQKNNGLKAQAKVLNKVALEVSEDLIDVAIKGGKVSQQIFGKVLNGGITLFGMQQDLVLSTMEQVAERVAKNEQLQKVVAVPTQYFNRFKKTAEDTTTKVKETFAAQAKKAKNEVVDAVNDIADELHITEAVETAKTEVVEAVANVKKELVATVKKATKTIDAGVETADFQKIDGIGPKVAEILVDAGIITFEQLAKSSTQEIEEVLVEAGSQYKKFNPAPWIEQAKFAAAGDWKGLDAWQAAN